MLDFLRIWAIFLGAVATTLCAMGFIASSMILIETIQGDTLTKFGLGLAVAGWFLFSGLVVGSAYLTTRFL